MKRNVVPLLAIAFVVASISTGVFYGLFAGRLRGASLDLPAHAIVVAAHDLPRGKVLKPEDFKLSEFRSKSPFKGGFDTPQKLTNALLIEPVAENEPITDGGVILNDASGNNGVPANMRAVSIHVYESTGVLGLLRRGSRVDIQAVAERNHIFQISTVLQNIEVLSVNTQPDNTPGARSTAPVVTILTRPQDSDVVALADSGTHLRLAVRNPLDDHTEPRKPLGVPVLFRNGDTSERGQGQ